jgi:hypothetical protein
MRKIFLLVTFLFVSMQLVTAQSTMKATPLLRHVVMFKFKDNATQADVKKIEDAFRALPGKIAEIKDFEWGVNNSPENLNQGLTHCFFITFHSAKDRDVYLVHPAHKAFVEVLSPFFEKATVLDYWAHK